MKLCSWSFVVMLASTPAAYGCGGDPAPDPVAPPPPANTEEPAAPTAPTATATATSPGTPLAIPETGDPANHYLDGETLFVATRGYTSNFIYASPGKQLAPPGADGQGTFWNFNTKKEVQSKFFWRTRAAKPDELAVGQLALIAHKKDSQGIYAAPDSVKQAYETRWWVTRIVSTRPLSEGYVLLAGNHRALPGAIRFLEGDPSPAIRKQGKEDAHFLADEHWFVGRGPLPDKSFTYVDPAVPAKPDAPLAGGEGRFVLTNSGALLLTRHAWQTRKATAEEIEKDQLVILPHLKHGSGYRAPKTRAEALATRWWAVKIVDTKKAAQGKVTVDGDHEVAIDGLRVVK